MSVARVKVPENISYIATVLGRNPLFGDYIQEDVILLFDLSLPCAFGLRDPKSFYRSHFLSNLDFHLLYGSEFLAGHHLFRLNHRNNEF